MADKKIIVEREDLSSLSSRIRTKAGSNADSLIWPNGFISAVDSIETGGGGLDPTGITATSADILDGVYTFDSTGTLVEGTIPTISPSKEELSTTTDYATIPLGYNPTVKTITIASSAVSDLNSNNILAGNTILGVPGSIPTQSISNPIISVVSQSIPVPSGYYAFDTAISIKSEDQAKLIPENIKSGITVLGITGTAEAGSATADPQLKNLIEGTLSEISDSTVTIVRDYAFVRQSVLASVNFPECSEIGYYAFQYCYSLNSISFPKCTSIGKLAFVQCSNLTSANFPLCTFISDQAFQSCYRLWSINFPVCTTIKGSAFTGTATNTAAPSTSMSYGSPLTDINFPACNYIGAAAFRGCSQLTTANFPECSEIGNYAFQYCYSLNSINFSKCSNIGIGAFGGLYSTSLITAYYGCNLSSIDFPFCLSIGSDAFLRCLHLTSANFPMCTNIGPSAFLQCSSLVSINFPECTRIGSSAFYSCKSLISIDFPACTNIGSSTFYACTSLTSIRFPVCTNIGSNAFKMCTSLTSIEFPVCTIIGEKAFSNCESLITAYFPVLTSLKSTEFAKLSYLQNVTIYGRSTSTIYASAFSGCYRLTNLTILRSEGIAPLVATNAFTYTPISNYTTYTSGVRGSIYVPASLVDAYKSATNWATFADRITAIPEE